MPPGLPRGVLPAEIPLPFRLVSCGSATSALCAAQDRSRQVEATYMSQHAGGGRGRRRIDPVQGQVTVTATDDRVLVPGLGLEGRQPLGEAGQSLDETDQLTGDLVVGGHLLCVADPEHALSRTSAVLAGVGHQFPPAAGLSGTVGGQGLEPVLPGAPQAAAVVPPALGVFAGVQPPALAAVGGERADEAAAGTDDAVVCWLV